MEHMGNPPRLLIIEDDTDINNLIKAILEKQGYETQQAFSGTEGKLRLELASYDMVILDLLLPGMTGEQLVEYIRKERRLKVPILILSAKSGLSDKVQLLTDGADDYLTKPFEPEELAARVLAMLRRSQVGEQSADEEKDCLTYKQLQLFSASHRLLVKGQELDLTPYEYEILFLLVQSPGVVFSRERLYEQVWKNGYYGEDNTVNVHVSNLRKKIAAVDPDEEYIKTVWGIGFKMA